MRRANSPVTPEATGSRPSAQLTDLQGHVPNTNQTLLGLRLQLVVGFLPFASTLPAAGVLVEGERGAVDASLSVGSRWHRKNLGRPSASLARVSESDSWIGHRRGGFGGIKQKVGVFTGSSTRQVTSVCDRTKKKPV